MLSAYAYNKPLQSVYLRTNGITHAEIWETDGGYQLALCSAPGLGYRESPEFGTPSQCIAWLRNVCNCAELDVR